LEVRETAHWDWIGQAIIDWRPTRVILLGDVFDMPSLSSWDRGKKAAEGRRIVDDLAAGNDCLARIAAPLEQLQAKQRQQKERLFQPDLWFTLGNHEYRIEREMESEARFDGLIAYEKWFDLHGFKLVPFLKPLWLDHIAYAHYFFNPMSGRPLGGTAEARLKVVGHTFTQGHQQVFSYGQRMVGGKQQHALIAGAAYLHHEEYLMGPQGDHPRGIVMKHNVNDGDYDIEWISMDRLCRRYEGVSLAEFLAG
jgi:hypothetical protein